ncbi:TetR/AcrR family transcriptional regulator C-terminal domain-containing protein [Planomonospora parontospora]|uniref:TetR/AcrR family transcriptional regulator C-terminal domain-containing protein n=1 Tax=Planomonospora parontospora TaxID=58119 RepID=UPI001670C874|nr:TetR/AcrR family transcriptional regulator C-terminal domain-containing protein [Planomonospora parontospora]GGL12526.1 transcriptional regulator [Planomonospora parontospora subsp. antibiotica]GII14025.1 transcriptional regulator [Planomonospora parontospora subsp. antibiotica]
MTDIPAPPWRKTRAPSAPRTALSRELIVSTGLRVVDAEGLEALSMRRVAQELGTGPASLYAHVANKEELLDLIYDRVMAEIHVPEPDPERWLEQLRDMVMDAFRVFSSHADIARVGLANIPTSPNALRIAEGQLAIMLAGGVPPRIAALMLDRFGIYICADAYESALYLNRQRGSDKDVESFLEETFGQIKTFYRNLPADRFPRLTAHVDALTGPDGDERFEFGLDLMLRGLASYVRDAGAGGPTSKD